MMAMHEMQRLQRAVCIALITNTSRANLHGFLTGTIVPNEDSSRISSRGGKMPCSFG